MWGPQCLNRQWICGTIISVWDPLWLCGALSMISLSSGTGAPVVWVVDESVGPSFVCRVISQSTGPPVWHAVASPRGGGGGNGATCPPPTSDWTPLEINAGPRRFSCRKKWGVGLQDFFQRFTCIDATANVLWSYDYEKRGSWRSCWRSYFGKPSVKLRSP